MRTHPAHRGPDRLRRYLAAMLIASFVFASAPAAARQSAQLRRPAFRAGVELIYVNVIVRDGRGEIVRGLDARDFTLSEDGKEQSIAAFDFEEVPVEPRPEAAIEPVPAILKAEAGEPEAPAQEQLQDLESAIDADAAFMRDVMDLRRREGEAAARQYAEQFGVIVGAA